MTSQGGSSRKSISLTSSSSRARKSAAGNGGGGGAGDSSSSQRKSISTSRSICWNLQSYLQALELKSREAKCKKSWSKQANAT